MNVTRNRPRGGQDDPAARDVRVSPVEELKLKAKLEDDFGLVRHGLSYGMAGDEPREIVLNGPAAAPVSKKVQAEHLLDFEAIQAVPDQLVTYFFWAEDIGPDGKPRRTSGDMFFAEVRHFEEIFRQGEQPPSGSAENEEQAGGQRPGGRPARRAPEADHQRHLEADPARNRREAVGAVRRGQQDPARVAARGHRAGGAAWRAASRRGLESEPGAGDPVHEGGRKAPDRGGPDVVDRRASAGPGRRAGRLPGLAQAPRPRVRGHPPQLDAAAAAEPRAAARPTGSSRSSSCRTRRTATRSNARPAPRRNSKRSRNASRARTGRCSTASASWPSGRAT